jgi:hypothetical protein
MTKPERRKEFGAIYGVNAAKVLARIDERNSSENSVKA